ncbi:MAG TPA: YMGG-like glycine zipper-containing protein [Pyrinomonadaceae bacterium]|nr:YMGG-like glycine zipper-containing protein [Pyrinomonadaceae bacterium]
MTLLLAFVSAGLTAQAQRARADRYQVAQIISRVESDTTRFRADLDNAIRNSRIDNTRRENNINLYISDFVSATAQLRARNDQRRATAADVRLVLDRATLVDNFLRRSQLEGNVNDDWATVRADLTELASAYGVTWTPAPARGGYRNNGGYGNNPLPNTGTAYGVDRSLTGTYRLDVSRSDDPRTAARNAAGPTSRYGRQQQSQDALLARLEAPDTLAIERRGTQVTIASTRAPQFTLTADGRERVEQLPNGRSVRAKATLYGDQLIVSTTGDRDTDFTVTFDPVENGQRLEVTRRISDINLRTPVTVRSVYERTSDVAQFDVYRGGGYTAGTTPTTTSGEFVVPDGVSLSATLDQDLSTRTTREGEQFTMTISQPSEYAGASLQGHISGVSRSGRVTGRSEMSFNFDRIVMRDGRSYSFSGFVEGIRSTNGESVRVDNEGGVRDNNQTDRTVQRTAIGTAVGAIIGAIAGGGSGAAIGAIVGAGAGAGSVYVQGRDASFFPRRARRKSAGAVNSHAPQRVTIPDAIAYYLSGGACVLRRRRASSPLPQKGLPPPRRSYEGMKIYAARPQPYRARSETTWQRS